MTQQDDALDYLNELARSDPAHSGADATYRFVGSVATALRSLRRRRGLSQAQLARRLGVSQGRISQIESGLVDHAPSLEMIAKFAAVCEEIPRLRLSGDFQVLVDEVMRIKADVPTLPRALVVAFSDDETADPDARKFMAEAVRTHPDEAEIVEGGAKLRLRGEIAREIAEAVVEGAGTTSDVETG